jgi:hypothetical protein
MAEMLHREVVLRDQHIAELRSEVAMLKAHLSHCRGSLAELVAWFDEHDDKASKFGELAVVTRAKRVLHG